MLQYCIVQVFIRADIFCAATEDAFKRSKIVLTSLHFFFTFLKLHCLEMYDDLNIFLFFKAKLKDAKTLRRIDNTTLCVSADLLAGGIIFLNRYL